MRHAPHLALLAPLALALTGCSEGSEPLETRSMVVSIHDIVPGGERTVCQVLDLGNEEPVVIRAIRTHLDPGSHHLILYRTDREPTATPSPCANFPGDENTLLIAQQAETALRYPNGTGLPVPAHQRILVEVHYMNYFAEPIDLNATVQFDTVPNDGSLAPVAVLFTGPVWLSIPPRDTYRIDTFHRVPEGSRIFALTSHTHQLGIYASLHRAKGVGDANATLLHESHDWSEPPLDVFSPALALAADEGLWLTCVWDNPHDDPVTFGSGFDDEMCFLWAYWY
jgi:hypothetical protein